MTTTRPETATRLAVAPRLLFEMRRTVGTMTSSGPGGGYPVAEVAFLATEAAALQRELGPDLFSVLFAVAVSASERDGGLALDGATARVVEQTGFHRVKASRLIRQLEDAGFLHLQQQSVPGRKGFVRSTTWLSPSLYRAAHDPALAVVRVPAAPHERALSVSHNGPAAGVTSDVADPDSVAASGAARHDTAGGAPGPNAVASRDSVGRDSVDAARDVAASDVARLDSAGVHAGRSAVEVQRSIVGRHPHENDDDDSHSSAGHDPTSTAGAYAGSLRLVGQGLVSGTSALDPGRAVAALVGQAAPVPAQDVDRLEPAALIELLRSWGVFDADKLVERTPRDVLVAKVREISGRWSSVSNPGAYLRTAVRDELARGTSPLAAASSQPAPRRAAAPPPSPTPADEEDPPSAGEIRAALHELAAETRAAVEARADAAVAEMPDNLRGFTQLVNGLRNATLARELRELGVLPRVSDPSPP